MRKSFQQRIFIGLTSLALLVSLLFGTGTLIIAYMTEDLLLTRLLKVEADRVTEIWKQTGELPLPSNEYFTIYQSKAAMPEWLRIAWQHSGPDEEVFADDEHYHIRGISLSDDSKPVLVAQVSRLLVVTKMAPGIAIILFMFALISIVFAILLAWRLAKVINLPLKILASDVESNQLSDTPDKNLPSEIALLRSKINDAFAALQKALEREQDFTRDVSHELRTPLTHLKNELLLLSEQNDKTLPKQSLTAMQQDVEDVEQTLSILLAIAREENLNTEEIKLKGAIESTLLKLHQHADLESLEINLEINDSYTIYASPVLLSLILQNILLNAILHGNGKLLIKTTGTKLMFSNAMGAPGKQSKGMGHGLKLVGKLADLMGADMQWQNDSQQFQVSISFNQ